MKILTRDRVVMHIHAPTPADVPPFHQGSEQHEQRGDEQLGDRPFFFNHTAPTEIYTLSLHDALPISSFLVRTPATRPFVHEIAVTAASSANVTRSEEHTSELQSRVDLVCRLLLE